MGRAEQPSLHRSEEANELIASDPMALLVGFALDQQVTVQKAFSGPLELKRRRLDRRGHARERGARARLPPEARDPSLSRQHGQARARARDAHPRRVRR